MNAAQAQHRGVGIDLAPEFPVKVCDMLRTKQLSHLAGLTVHAARAERRYLK